MAGIDILAVIQIDLLIAVPSVRKRLAFLGRTSFLIKVAYQVGIGGWLLFRISKNNLRDRLPSPFAKSARLLGFGIHDFRFDYIKRITLGSRKSLALGERYAGGSVPPG